MKSEYVVEFIKLLNQNNIEVYIDGGWAVDAVLGEQTREHEDLDIALPHKYVLLLRRILEEKGFKDIPRDDTRDCNFVLGDEHGHLFDIHSYTFDVLVEFHTGYEVDENDYYDVKALCNRFNIALPKVYEKFSLTK